MKKVLGMLTAVISIFAFTLTVGAEEAENRTTEPEAIKHECPKCPLGEVKCPGKTAVAGVQGTMSTYNNPSSPFDYDGNPAIADGYGSYGYEAGFNYANDPERNCKFLFDVCSCGKACDVKAGERIGIQMLIRTPGVYFADPSNTILFDMYENWSNPVCNTNADAQPTHNLMQPANIYYDANGNVVSGVPGEGEVAVTQQKIRSFNNITYYTGFDERDYTLHEGTADEKLLFETTFLPANVGTPLGGEKIGTVLPPNRVIALQSDEDTDYMITQQDATEATGQCRLWIDIPAMRVDPTVAQPGAIIQVTVRLLFNREIEGICTACDPPDVCDVTIDVGMVCDGQDNVVPNAEHCMFFPMVLQNSSGWQTGIAISAREALPDDAQVTLELYDTKSEDAATYTKTFTGKGRVWSFVLDNILNEFDKPVEGGFASLRVISNYSMDGYQFLNAGGTFGAGSNARGCDGECCPK